MQSPINFHRFLAGVDYALLDRYVDVREAHHVLTVAELINPQMCEAALARPDQAETRARIRDDFARIYDVGTHAGWLIHQVYAGHSLPYAPALDPLHHAMALFLDHPKAFKEAEDRYSIYTGKAAAAAYYLEPQAVSAPPPGLARFRACLREHFEDAGKGSGIDVHAYEDALGLIIRVTRGSYVRTYPLWDDQQVSTTTFRPARDDFLMFDTKMGILHVRTPIPAERERYLDFFCEHILSRPTLAEQARQERVYDLGPFQTGTFDYSGNEHIAGVELRAVTLELLDASGTKLRLDTDHVPDALEAPMFEHIELASGILHRVKLRVRIAHGGKGRPHTFEIGPPNYTTLTDRRDAAVIEDYLVEQGVKLR